MNAKNRFCRMLRMTARESTRAFTMPVRSPLSSVTPALSIATSAPVPMAMPTSADAIAGHRYGVALATKSCNDGIFLIREHFSLDLDDAQVARDRLRRGAIVASEHDHADTVRSECSERIGRRCFHWVGDSDDASGLAVHCKKHGSCTVAPQTIGLRRERRRVDIQFLKKPGVAQNNPGAIDHAGHAFSGGGVEFLNGGEFEFAFNGSGDNGSRQRMLTVTFDARRK